MRTIEWKINTGYVGATYEGSFEVKDDATDKEIDDMVQKEVWDYIELSWNEKKKEN